MAREILRSVLGRQLGLDKDDNLVLGGTKLYFGHSSKLDSLLDLSNLSAGGNKLGQRLTYDSPAGSVAATPAITSTTGRLWVTLSSGNATWTSLPLGDDGQILLVINADSTSQLTLPANVFIYSADLILPPKDSALLCCDTTQGAWINIG